MDQYRALDLTARAHAIARRAPAAAPAAAGPPPPGAAIPGYGRVAQRAPAAVYPEGPSGLKVAARALGVISYGAQDVQLAAVEQARGVGNGPGIFATVRSHSQERGFAPPAT
jgi:hypothetical protein